MHFRYTDHLGSTIFTTRAGGTIIERVRYEPFGARVSSTAPAPRFGFTGQRFEPGTGIYDYGARWYDPQLGRFLQPDSIVPDPLDPQSLNRYAYVRNNPVNLIDPTGHSWASFWGGVQSFGFAFAEVFGGFGAGLGDAFIPNFSQMLGSTSFDGRFGFEASRSLGNAVGAILSIPITLGGAGLMMGGGLLSPVPVLGQLGGGLAMALGSAVTAYGASSIYRGSRGALEHGFAAGNSFFQKQHKDVVIEVEGPSGDSVPVSSDSQPYKRPSGATTPEQRRSVQGRPCVDCGAEAPRMNADHRDPPVVQHYRDGTINRERMRSSEAVQPQCPTCSNSQGGRASAFSRRVKQALGIE